MPAIGMRGALRRIVRFGRDRNTRLYYAACVCLLVLAAGLRFHDLSEHYLRFDEAAAANYSRGTFSEVISNTRWSNSSPVLYPLVLYAVQKIESTHFSIRFVPATASVLVVAVMLLWLPRLGVARGAAFLAALLATLSVEAIRHAQDAREYSIDALVALLMLAGLLRYLRDGKKALLGASLFVAPLVQYGLVLFGVAVIGAAAVAPRAAGPDWRSAPAVARRIGDWLKRRLDLASSCGFFLAGSTVSYMVTLRHQGSGGVFGPDGYLSRHYYQGGFDALSLFEFAIGAIWSLLTYHVPEFVAVIAMLAVFAFLMVAVFRGKFHGKFPDSVIAVVFSFAIAVSVGAAVLGIYPLGEIRQSIYLGPVIFLVAGIAFPWMAGCLSALARRAWLAPALAVAVSGAIALSGGGAIRRADVYRPHDKMDEILAVLQERAQEEDVVYVSYFMPATMEFHPPPESEMSMMDATVSCGDSPKGCFSELIAAISQQAGGKLWLVFRDSWPPPSEEPDIVLLQLLATQVSVEHVVSGGKPNLYLIEDTESLIRIAAATDMLTNLKPILPRKPLIRSSFDIHLREDMLVYVKDSCGAEDQSATFFLHVFPADVDDLPDRRKRHGFDNLDFHFNSYGMRLAEQCVALHELPDYPIARIRTGQFSNEGTVWEENFDHPTYIADLIEEMIHASDAEFAIRDYFDVYAGQSKLVFVRNQCGATDTDPQFFVHIYPVDVDDLPAHRRQYGFGGLDFSFNDHGIRSAEQCVAWREFPDYAISSIRTGQYIVNEDGSTTHLWEGEVRFDE